VTAGELLTDLARQGFTLAREGGGIRVQPASRLTDALRVSIHEYKADLLALLPPRWDQPRAAAVLAEVNRDLDSARRLHRAKAARVAVLDVYGELARDYHAGRDPMLFEVHDALAKLLARWGEVDRGAYKPPGADWSDE
jgi:hypothetical protein